MKSEPYTQPILSCAEAKKLEADVLPDESAAWAAMGRAGRGIAGAVLRDYLELREVPDRLRIVALVGKGHNGGDALIACGHLLATRPRASVDLVMSAPESELKPLTARALQQLDGRVRRHVVESASAAHVTDLLDHASGGNGFHICIDGLLGMDVSGALRAPLDALVEGVNAYPNIDLRAAVDLPSGTGDHPADSVYNADFTYATGVAKRPLFEGIADCGRVRCIDLDFFEHPAGKAVESEEYLLHPKVLKPLNRLRPAFVDKREFGHLFVVGGSAFMPGALLMTVQAAVRSGVGLVTAFAPESVAASLSAQVPEAMWVPWPETSNGTLSPRALPLLTDRIKQATALLVGPGLGMDRNTEMLCQEIAGKVETPLLFDADGLRPRVVEMAKVRKPHFGEVVLTPHMGEFMRVAKIGEPDASTETLLEFARVYRVITVLKGSNTRISDGEKVYFNTNGGPVLSRGGSGDLLSGLIGGMMAQNRDCIRTAVARGVTLHGLAAQQLARTQGQIMVHTTQLLDYLSEVLRSFDVNSLSRD